MVLQALEESESNFKAPYSFCYLPAEVEINLPAPLSELI